MDLVRVRAARGGSALNEPVRIAPYRSLDTAIAVTKQLQREACASLMDVDSEVGSTTIHLSVPVRGLPGMKRMRRELWISFIERNLRSRRDLASRLEVQLMRQREAVETIRRKTEATRRLVDEARRPRRVSA